jgi:hypothetical protein
LRTILVLKDDTRYFLPATFSLRPARARASHQGRGLRGAHLRALMVALVELGPFQRPLFSDFGGAATDRNWPRLCENSSLKSTIEHRDFGEADEPIRRR